jgi:hypothetical protein
MTARTYIPAGLTHPDGHPKAPHELVEYSSTVFDTSLDDADRRFNSLAKGDCAPLEQIRARTVADAVVAIMRSKGDHLAKTRKHIVSLGLTPATTGPAQSLRPLQCHATLQERGG